jgi:hypothetical protein
LGLGCISLRGCDEKAFNEVFLNPLDQPLLWTHYDKVDLSLIVVFASSCSLRVVTVDGRI